MRTKVRSLHKSKDKVTCTVEWRLDFNYYMAHPYESRKYMPKTQVTHEDYGVIKERAPELLCDYWQQHT